MKLKLSIIVFVILIVVMVVIKFGNNHNDADFKNKTPQLKEPTKHLEKKSADNIEPKLEITTKNVDDIKEYNAFLMQKGFSSTAIRPLVSFEGLRIKATDNVEQVSKVILDLSDKPKDYLFELLELNYQCTGLLENETQIDSVLATRPFEKALWDSGYCSRLGTEEDPFFDYLKLARRGVKTAQLVLSGELNNAIRRGAIKPKLNPIEYNDFKNEAIDYLKILSNQGVSLASLKLSREYLTDTLFLPADRVLSYVYLSRYEDHNDYAWTDCFSDSVFCKTPSELYQQLTKAEKTRADRVVN